MLWRLFGEDENVSKFPSIKEPILHKADLQIVTWFTAQTIGPHLMQIFANLKNFSIYGKGHNPTSDVIESELCAQFLYLFLTPSS